MVVVVGGMKGGNAIAFASYRSLWQQTNISEAARQPVISNIVGASDSTVA